MDEKSRAFGSVWSDIKMLVASGKKERHLYPTQKPIALLERIIKSSSNEGDVVFDCFAGSGTTLAAARKLNRNWIGIDQSANSCDIIKKRLNLGEYKKWPSNE